MDKYALAASSPGQTLHLEISDSGFKGLGEGGGQRVEIPISSNDGID